VRSPGPKDRRIFRMLKTLAAAQRKIDSLQAKMIGVSAAEIERLEREIQLTLKGVESRSDQWVRREMASLFGEGVTYASLALREKTFMSALTRSALAQLQQDTFLDLARATQFIGADVKRSISEVASRFIQLQIEEGLGISVAKRQMREELRDLGVRFTDRSGKRWRLDRYSEMVVRTKSAQAFNTGTVMRARELGVGRFRVLDGTRDRVCQEANGKIWTAQWALENPVGHPNCTRAFAPVT
jgi:hypothetical protein